MTLHEDPPQQRSLPAFMRKTREKYPRAWAPWSAEEDELLQALAARGAAPQELVEALGRGPGGIAARKVALGLEPPRQPLHRGSWGQPVPQMDWVPEWHDHMPEEPWVAETARFWGVGPDNLAAVLEELSLDQWTVFVLRYGLSRRCSYTVEAVAELLDTSRKKALALQHEAEEAVVAGLRGLGEALEEISLDETLKRQRRRRR